MRTHNPTRALTRTPALELPARIRPSRLLPLLLAALSASAQTSSPNRPQNQNQPQNQPQTLPPTSPTALPQAPASPRPRPTSARSSTHSAQVDFTAGNLAISADNSSLNQILRDIARVTGMKITGGVSEERVFGTYGPGDPSSVLSALLNGTGSNMLLLFNDQRLPAELVLSPRQGGPTPPNPNAVREADTPPSDQPDLSPQRQPRPVMPAVNFTPPNNIPQGSMPQPGMAQPGATTDTTQQSPNGVKTPQQIYDQLMQLQQQQQPKPPPQ